MISKDNKCTKNVISACSIGAYLAQYTNKSILLCLPDSTYLAGVARVSQSSERNEPLESIRYFQALVNQGTLKGLKTIARCSPKGPEIVKESSINLIQERPSCFDCILEICRDISNSSVANFRSPSEQLVISSVTYGFDPHGHLQIVITSWLQKMQHKPANFLCQPNC